MYGTGFGSGKALLLYAVASPYNVWNRRDLLVDVATEAPCGSRCMCLQVQVNRIVLWKYL